MHILLAVDGSIYTRHMLDYLAAHPKLLGAEPVITVFTAVTSISSYAKQFADAQAVEAHYKELADEVLVPIQKFADRHGWLIKLRHTAGYPADVIAAFVNESQPDLLVMGTHGDTALANLVLGSVVTGVLARCKVPVLLIR
jgi:nucleotide-binding universal stress UspA family protein